MRIDGQGLELNAQFLKVLLRLAARCGPQMPLDKLADPPFSRRKSRGMVMPAWVASELSVSPASRWATFHQRLLAGGGGGAGGDHGARLLIAAFFDVFITYRT